MSDDRIFFKDNPWPEGHPIKEFTWRAEIRDEAVWFQLHLVTADYYSEREIEDEDELEEASDWYNFHNCTISSSFWHDGGFRVCDLAEYSPDWLDSKNFSVDLSPIDLDEPESRAFAIYLLGHDSAFDHRISFTRIGNSNEFSIAWRGKIARTYIGSYEPEYEFETNIASASFPHIQPRA